MPWPYRPCRAVRNPGRNTSDSHRIGTRACTATPQPAALRVSAGGAAVVPAVRMLSCRSSPRMSSTSPLSRYVKRPSRSGAALNAGLGLPVTLESGVNTPAAEVVLGLWRLQGNLTGQSRRQLPGNTDLCLTYERLIEVGRVNQGLHIPSFQRLFASTERERGSFVTKFGPRLPEPEDCIARCRRSAAEIALDASFEGTPAGKSAGICADLAETCRHAVVTALTSAGLLRAESFAPLAHRSDCGR